MNLNAMFVGIFVFTIMFSALLVTMPSDFIVLGIDAEVQDKEVVDFFNEHNVTVYNQTYLINPLEYGVSNQSDFGLPEGQKLEFWWDADPWWGDIFELRHLTNDFWGWWWGWHYLRVQEPYASNVEVARAGLLKADVLALFNEDYNATYCEFACDHISVKLFIMTYNQSWTLEESWNNHKLKIFTSYEIDRTKTGTSMWHVMGQLLSFQNPQLGIPGTFGQILGAGIGAVLWACIGILFYALITSLIPFISGWRGD